MTNPQTKESCIQMAKAEFELLLSIIGDLGIVGYRVALFRLKGHSIRGCARKFGIPKSNVARIVKKCTVNRYDIILKDMNIQYLDTTFVSNEQKAVLRRDKK